MHLTTGRAEVFILSALKFFGWCNSTVMRICEFY
jgi:hypothetical protein